VLYPQATSWRRLTDPSGLTASPDGCWDWWGYAGDDAYFTRDGKQMRAVRAMIARMLPRSDRITREGRRALQLPS